MYIYEQRRNYPERFNLSFLGEPAGSFSPAADSSVATPAFSAAERSKLTTLLTPTQSEEAIKWNRAQHPAKSGVRFQDIVTDLTRYVDFGAVRAAILKAGGSYKIEAGTIDALCVEAAHQFQAKAYFHADDQTVNNKDAIVHKDNPQESDQVAAGIVVMDRYQGMMTPYSVRPIKSAPSDANSLWREACRIFEKKLLLPYADATEPHLRYLAYNAGIARVSREVADAVGGLWLELQRRLAAARNQNVPSDRLRDEVQRYARSVKVAVEAGTTKYKREVEPLIGEIDRDLEVNRHRIPKGTRIVDSAQPPRQPWESAWRDYGQELEKSVKSLDLSQSNPERFFPEDDFVAAVE